MTYVWQRWIIPELREALEAKGYRLIVVEGAENRGRPASTGHFDPRGPVTKHHTGATASVTNPHPTLRTLIVGRPDLPGPLSQVSTGYDGSVYVIACGRANHAGAVGKSGVIGMPLGADGNALALGDEVETNGLQDLPPAQLEAMAIVDRVFVDHMGKPVEWIHRHADISGSGKWDIGNRTTQQLRDDAAAADTEEDPMAGIELKDIRQVVAEEAEKAVAAGTKDVLQIVRKLFTNQRVILKERFNVTDSDLDDLLGKVDDLVDQATAKP